MVMMVTKCRRICQGEIGKLEIDKDMKMHQLCIIVKLGQHVIFNRGLSATA